MFASIQQNKINSAVLFAYLIRTLMMPQWFVPENNLALATCADHLTFNLMDSFSSSFLTSQFQSHSALSTCTAMLPLQSMASHAIILSVSRHWQQLPMPCSTMFPLRQLSQWAQHLTCTSGCAGKCHTFLCTFLVPAVPLTRLADSTLTFRMWCNSACKKLQ